jgi:5-methylcytosine-specific restriction endonuclease McrA
MDITTAPTEYLEAELVAHAAFEATGMARMLDVLAEFDRRRVWDSWGCASPQQWLGWKCGLGYGAASERLRVARALSVLPHVRDGLSRGKLSYSKVRELTRIATPDTDQCLAEIAGCATAAQVATMVRQLRRRTPGDVTRQVESRGLRWEVDDSDGSMVFTLRVPTEVGQAVVASIESVFVPEAGVPAHQTRADVCARLICGDDEHRARPEVFVHLHGDATSFEDGTAVAPEIVESLACDGPVTTVIDTDAGPAVIKRDPPPSRAQRRWLKLRHRTCQFPGCHHAGSFDAHHVVHRSQGGKTRLSNLVRLCQFHHRLVHTLDLRLALHPDRRLEVRFPAGNPVDRNIPFAPFVAPAPDDPNLISSNWTGERLQLDYVLLAVASAESATRHRRSTAEALVA